MGAGMGGAQSSEAAGRRSMQTGTYRSEAIEGLTDVVICELSLANRTVVPRLKCGQGECVGDDTANRVNSVCNDRGKDGVSGLWDGYG